MNKFLTTGNMKMKGGKQIYLLTLLLIFVYNKLQNILSLTYLEEKKRREKGEGVSIFKIIRGEICILCNIHCLTL